MAGERKQGERIYYLNCSQRNKPSHKNARYSSPVHVFLLGVHIHLPPPYILLLTWLFANRNSFAPLSVYTEAEEEKAGAAAVNAHVGIILNLCARVMANSSY